jgi:hypothetical protein
MRGVLTNLGEGYLLDPEVPIFTVRPRGAA